MKLFNDRFGTYFLPLGLLVTLGSCGVMGGANSANDAPASHATNGPSSDYPVIIGDPYVSNGVTYTPSDVWNYDEVGRIASDLDTGTSVSGSHHTLPLPSYVEVTSLDTGRTILIRLTRRGPMSTSSLIGLSAGALDQLNVAAGAAVRVRRVNPPEQERAKLRGGERAAERMETPMSLVKVLRRKLPDGDVSTPIAGGTSANSQTPSAPYSSNVPTRVEVLTPPPSAVARPSVRPSAVPTLAPAPTVTPARTPSGGYFVQAGAYSTKARAERVARALGGAVSRTGSLFRVRTGPFTSRSNAQGSLAKVKAAGYSDARIYKGG